MKTLLSRSLVALIVLLPLAEGKKINGEQKDCKLIDMSSFDIECKGSWANQRPSNITRKEAIAARICVNKFDPELLDDAEPHVTYKILSDYL